MSEEIKKEDNCPVCQGENCECVKDERAPWMKIALEEYEKYKGINESKDPLKSRIEKVYHKEGGGITANSSVAWCASFVNWCLMQVGLNNWHSASSQAIIENKNMKKIEEPVYGAIITMKNYVAKTGKEHFTGHSTFLFGETEDKEFYIGLGGNQSNQLKFSKYRKTGISSSFTLKGVRYNQKFYGLYIPNDYDVKEIDKLTDEDICPNDLTEIDTTTR
ncbi:MAG: TIGR02594 family protein [Pseudoleptotrichia goodfellowii]|nr:TIGR02594 family protein [Pseudoleptotrichia goodfellowii]